MRPLELLSCLPSRAVMDIFPVALLLLSGFFLVEPVLARQTHGLKPFLGTRVKSWKASPLRAKRHSSFHQISECVFVSSEEKFYVYKSDSGSEEVCGVYLFTDPDKVIEIHFQYLNVPCKNGGLVTFFDGWELGGEYFPGEEDGGDFGQRYQEFCGEEKPEKVLVTSQNAGMLHYRVPTEGSGFSFYVKFSKTTAPCNILVENQEGVYTLNNHGRNRNCTLIAVFPAKVDVLGYDVGVSNGQLGKDTGHQCEDKKKKDGLEVGGSEGLDPSRLVPFREFCGLDFSPERGSMVIGCGVTVVRLLSTGRYDNSATFRISLPEEIDLLESPFICSL